MKRLLSVSLTLGLVAAALGLTFGLAAKVFTVLKRWLFIKCEPGEGFSWLIPKNVWAKGLKQGYIIYDADVDRAFLKSNDLNARERW